MPSTPETPMERYAAVVAALRDNPGVTPPSDGLQPKQRFGSSGLKINNKIFAMLVNGSLVVKLPRQRVDALIAAGVGERFERGQGRPMKEWLTVAPTSEAEWLPLAQEALAFVAAQR